MPVGNKFAESQGLSYVPNDAYLQEGFKGSTPLDFSNISSSGIMSQAPVATAPLQYVPQGGDGDGPPTGPAVDNTVNDYEFDALGSVPNSDNVGLTEEEQAALDASIKGPQMGKLGTIGTIAGMFAAPLTTIGYHYRNNKKKQKKLDDAVVAAGIKADFEREIVGRKGQAYYDRAVATAAGRDPNQGNSVTGFGQSGLGRNPDDKMAKGGRVGYFFGGRVNYKAGGRTDAGANRSTASHSTRGQINEAGQQVNNNSGNNSGNDKPTFYSPPDKKTITTDFISKNPNLTIDYTDPRNFASLKGKVGFGKFLDNDDITAEGNVTGEFGPISYDASLTEKGLTGVDLTAGNFNADLNPDMQVQNIGYNNNINGINYGVNTDFDNTMFTAGVNFKNGGLASIL